MEKTAIKPSWKTPRRSPPAFPTFPQLQRRLRLLKLGNFVVLSRERKPGKGMRKLIRYRIFEYKAVPLIADDNPSVV
jgi:hypothetical protein